MNSINLTYVYLQPSFKFRMKQEWELKESIIKSIAWNEPSNPLVFNFSTFQNDVETSVTTEHISRGTSYTSIIFLILTPSLLRVQKTLGRHGEYYTIPTSQIYQIRLGKRSS